MPHCNYDINSGFSNDNLPDGGNTWGKNGGITIGDSDNSGKSHIRKHISSDGWGFTQNRQVDIGNGIIK